MRQQRNLVRGFVYSAGVLLLITAAAKFVSGFGSAGILQRADPILNLPFRSLFWFVGGLELAVAIISLFSKDTGWPVILIAWLSTNFAVYRVGLLWVGYLRPCPCLGNVTDALHVSPHTADSVLKAILGYLLVGSWLIIFWPGKKSVKESVVVAKCPPKNQA